MECPPCSWSTRWETYHHEEAKEIWDSQIGSEYYNYKGFFSLVLLALVNAEYRFLCIDIWSDAQIFNLRQLRKQIEDGTLRLPPPEPMGESGPDLEYFLPADNAFTLMPWLVKPYSRRQLTREERMDTTGSPEAVG